jgi:hypothetical protein
LARGGGTLLIQCGDTSLEVLEWHKVEWKNNESWVLSKLDDRILCVPTDDLVYQKNVIEEKLERENVR